MCAREFVNSLGEWASTSNEISYEYYLLLCRSTDAITMWISSNFFSFFCPLFMYHKSVICSAPPRNSIADALMLIHTIHIWLWCIQMLIFFLFFAFSHSFIPTLSLFFPSKKQRKRNRTNCGESVTLENGKETVFFSIQRKEKNIIGLFINKLLQNKVTLAFKIKPLKKSLRLK